jgi:hypothetical protein
MKNIKTVTDSNKSIIIITIISVVYIVTALLLKLNCINMTKLCVQHDSRDLVRHYRSLC